MYYEKRGFNNYRFVVSDGYDITGKQIKRTKTVHLSNPKMPKKEADKELMRAWLDFESEVKGLGVRSANVKFQIIAEEYLKQMRIEKSIKQLSIERHMDCCERTYKAIGHLTLDKINTYRIQSFINSLAQPGVNKNTGGSLSTKSQKSYITFISDVFNYASQRCNIPVKNPCHGVKAVKVPTEKAPMFTIKEAQQFFEAIIDEPLKYRAAYAIAAYLGLRHGEILGLEWDDIDFEHCLIKIRRESVKSKEMGTIEETPKTEKSNRVLKGPEQLFTLLKMLKAEQDEQIKNTGDQWVGTGRLFTQWNGVPMGTSTLRNKLNKICKDNNFKVVNIRSFRHFTATVLISSGTDLKTVSSILGHSIVGTTTDTYAETVEEAKAKASKAVSEILEIKIV